VHFDVLRRNFHAVTANSNAGSNAAAHGARAFLPPPTKEVKMFIDFKRLGGEPLAAMASLSCAFMIFAVMPHLIFI
jgi:hypothetical protein